MTGTGENDGVAAPEVVEAIQSLHHRIDELHRLVAQRLTAEEVQAETWLHTAAATASQRPALPAWQRVTRGELRWPVALTTALGIGLQVFVPDRLTLVRPSWILPAAQGALLVVLITANPQRIDRESRALRTLSLVLAALLSLANGWSAARLAIGITEGTMGKTAGPLLITGAVIWLTNVVAFALWYWEFDRGGPVARALGGKDRYPDLLYPQMTLPPELVSPDWEPGFVDYLYLAFTNATAFSPTDVLPLSRWAKVGMTVQSVISLVTVALVVSRAVNIFP